LDSIKITALNVQKFLQEKTVKATKQKDEQRKNLSPRNWKAATALALPS
jgi:hypothetical protein